MQTAKRVLACLIAGWLSFQNCSAETTAEEVERREAAAGFILPLAASLTLLRLECRQFLSGSNDDVDKVALAWWTRNRDDLDAATWITAEALQRYRLMPREKAMLAERQMLQAVSKAQLEIVRSMFHRQIPSAESCRKAVQRYASPELDVANFKTTKGFERFSEFGDTLKRTRADNAYRPRDDRSRTFEAQVAPASSPLATLDAIEAAKERKDFAAVVDGYRSLVDRGDAKAAQTLGLLYMNEQAGKERDLHRAAAWFYNAWAMGEAEGINALGVMARDGLGMPTDKVLAIVAFAVAKEMAKQGQLQALGRANSNHQRLAMALQAKELSTAACMRGDGLVARFRELAASPDLRLHLSPKVAQGSLAESGVFIAATTGPCET